MQNKMLTLEISPKPQLRDDPLPMPEHGSEITIAVDPEIQLNTKQFQTLQETLNVANYKIRTTLFTVTPCVFAQREAVGEFWLTTKENIAFNARLNPEFKNKTLEESCITLVRVEPFRTVKGETLGVWTRIICVL